jgi:hypothetical protein
MDINARFQYYEYVKNHPKEKIPIIASHVAMSGKEKAWAMYTGLCPVFDVYEEVEDMDRFISYQRTLPCTREIIPSAARQETMNWFYPWSINLCNEEIPIIYESDGIIGLSLEERVLGKNRKNHRDPDYIARLTTYLKGKGYDAHSIDTIFWMQPLLHNIFHVVRHSGRNDGSAWNHIAIGSDFDGIMKPVQYCPTVEYLPNLRSLLTVGIYLFAEYTQQQSLLHDLPIEEIADRILFKNGERFILKYY